MQRYFEDVNVGDELEPVEHLPTEDLAIDFFDRDSPTNPAFGDAEAGRKQGFGGALVPGVLKLSWITKFANDWAGQEGWVINTRAAFRRPDVAGRPLVVAGRVVDKRVDGEKNVVELEVVTLASGEPSIRANVQVALPKRA